MKGGKSEQLFLDLYSYKGLKISEAFTFTFRKLNVKIHTDSSCFQEGFLAFFTEQMSRLSLLCEVWC